MFEYTFLTPYPYIRNDYVLNGLILLRYVDLRSQYLSSERLLDEALDKYSFIRDAYLQNRHYLISGEAPQTDSADSLYVEEDGNGYVEDKPTLAPATTKAPPAAGN